VWVRSSGSACSKSRIFFKLGRLITGKENVHKWIHFYLVVNWRHPWTSGAWSECEYTGWGLRRVLVHCSPSRELHYRRGKLRSSNLDTISFPYFPFRFSFFSVLIDTSNFMKLLFCSVAERKNFNFRSWNKKKTELMHE